jgi:hypothetical protein
VETARLALKDSDDVFTQPIDNEQDAEELSRLLHEKIESLERLNTSLECPAGSDLDEEDSRANVIIHATKGEPQFSCTKAKTQSRAACAIPWDICALCNGYHNMYAWCPLRTISKDHHSCKDVANSLT